ncbi:MAG: acyl CoA:acetate/3-ketoacid CoA transferase [Deltaproteobacteria bacterium HGW-Deltaproteobacteria-13]|jgi:propionate CoA-transferase|nr:MAG: acyl CoA:acetate/3-ketoacid CoA transferase [Deltaproteobacteria bacterium HGW-Deltaproteobacteria-13]
MDDIIQDRHPIIADLARRMKRGKVVDVDEAVRIIRSGDTVAFSGFIGSGFAEGVAKALEKRFVSQGEPGELTLIYSAGMGDGKDKGLNHLAHEGLIRRVIGGHWGLVPKLQKLAIENKIDAYNLPQGVISHMYRDIAAHNPRTLSKVGLGTFVDPRRGGGKINQRTREDIVELIEFDGKECLAFKPQPIQVAILRGTTADLDGNATMEREALTLEVLSLAMAARNSGGVVIVQVERIAERGSLRARDVKIPGILVDCVVVADPDDHWMTFAERYNPSYSSEIKMPVASLEPLPLDVRKIIARRAAMELKINSVINLGIGMPESIARVAAEEGLLEYITLTAEPGVIGGIPAGGLSFGAAANVEAIVDQPYQFDFYDGGGLDLAFLGLAQADRAGNLNVSRFGSRLAGAGGFINISQNAKKVVFTGTFTAGELQIEIEDEKLKLIREGEFIKFVQAVDQITFSGAVGAESGRPVIYVTERCVFELNPEGLVLIEIAPGIDLQKDILAKMEFMPVIAKTLIQMDARIFRHEPMGLIKDLLTLPMDERFTYQPKENLLFINFEGLSIRSRKDIEDIRDHVKRICEPLGKRVQTIVNYDIFSIVPELIEPYTAMVNEVVDRYYYKVTRYTTNAFMRVKLGDVLAPRAAAKQALDGQV